MTAAAERTSGDLARLLLERVGERDSGILTATRGRQRRLFCLSAGRLIFAASNVVEERFGRELVRRGLLDERQLRASEQSAADSSRKLGQVLLEQENQDERELGAAMGGYAEELLRSTLGWQGATYSFNSGKPDLTGEPTASIAPARVVWEHFVTVSPTPPAWNRLGPERSRPRLAGSAKRWRALVETIEPATPILRRCDGTRTLTKVIREEVGDERETFAALRVLLLLRALELDDTPVAGPAQGLTRDECLARFGLDGKADHYEVLGLSRDATLRGVREAYYQLARRFHPDRFRSGDLQELLDEAESFFSRVTEAYNTLNDPARRQAYDAEQEAASTRADQQLAQDPGYLARQNFQRARTLIQRKRFQDALRFLENAVEIEGDNARYRLELGRLLASNPRRRDDAARHLEEATRADPGCVEAYYELGVLYAKQSRADEAAAKFREVLRWQPHHADAAAALEELAAGEDSGSGFLRNLFKG